MIGSTPLPVRTDDGHASEVLWVPAVHAQRAMLWLPALGVAARHYLPFAGALAERGVSVALHEWRGHGSSTWRAARGCDWGYQTLLETDIPASMAAVRSVHQGPVGIGGHSLGGQLAACHAALSQAALDRLWLVASGAPYWRAFPSPLRYGLPFAYRFLPWLARVNGALPGRRIGFGGTEAAGVMRDWARTALSGHYRVGGWPVEIEGGFSTLDMPVHAVTLQDDWLAPRGSLDHLISKMPGARVTRTELAPRALGVPADHFAWMQAPGAVAHALDC